MSLGPRSSESLIGYRACGPKAAASRAFRSVGAGSAEWDAVQSARRRARAPPSAPRVRRTRSGIPPALGRGRSVAHKLIEAHLLGGEMTPGREIALRIDQTLTQDATGTVVMLEFERLALDRVRTELAGRRGGSDADRDTRDRSGGAGHWRRCALHRPRRRLCPQAPRPRPAVFGCRRPRRVVARWINQPGDRCAPPLPDRVPLGANTTSEPPGERK